MGVVRGAVCAENTAESIEKNATELIGEIFTRNNIDPRSGKIEAILFTATEDLTAAYPATAVRKAYGLSDVAFVCAREMSVEHSLEHCLRAAVFVRNLDQRMCKHCYIGKAAVLRPDLS